MMRSRGWKKGRKLSYTQDFPSPPSQGRAHLWGWERIANSTASWNRRQKLFASGEEKGTLRKHHSVALAHRPPETKTWTGELRNPLAPTTRLIPSKRQEEPITEEGHWEREALSGSSLQSLLKAEGGARRLRKTLQHSRPHTRYKVATGPGWKNLKPVIEQQPPNWDQTTDLILNSLH